LDVKSDVTVKQPSGPAEGTRPGRTYRPNVDIGETRDAVWMTVDLPGVDEKTVQVDLEDGVLTIQARVDAEEYRDLTPVYSEYNVGNFERTFRLSSRIDSNAIQARIEHGVLHLTLPRAEAARPRSIAISGS
jgi:HSP20 family molecular chaperone IbpA